MTDGCAQEGRDLHVASDKSEQERMKKEAAGFARLHRSRMFIS